MPKILAMVHKNRHTPLPALIFTVRITLFCYYLAHLWKRFDTETKCRGNHRIPFRQRNLSAESKVNWHILLFGLFSVHAFNPLSDKPLSENLLFTCVNSNFPTRSLTIGFT